MPKNKNLSNITLVIPAKNEIESLPKVLNELKKYSVKKIIVIDPNDLGTIKSIKNYKCRIIKQKKPGYGNALMEGLSKVKTKYFCIFNADGSFNPKTLHKMHNNLNNNNFVFASRYMPKAGSDDDTFITLIGNKIFTLIGNIFFNLNISDILFTYVGGNTNLANKLGLKNESFGFCVELPISIKKRNFSYTSIASHERKRIGGKKKVNAFRDGLIILIEMIKLFFKKN